MDESVEGSCLCGKLSYSVKLPVKWVAHCHCSLCRKANGAAFVTWFGIQKNNFALDAGEEYLTWYSHTEGAKRGFCKSCGSSVFFQSINWPDELHLTLANMKQSIQQLPTANAYYDSHVVWANMDSLKKIHRDGSNMDNNESQVS